MIHIESMCSIICAKHLEFIKHGAWDLENRKICLEERNDEEELPPNVLAARNGGLQVKGCLDTIWNRS